MTPPEHPDDAPLTRKQLRNLRNTGATPIIVQAEDDDASDETAEHAPPPAPVAPLPRAAEPVPEAGPPMADAAVDLGVTPLTRRQARQQERIRTASVPVITPEVAAAHAAATADDPDTATGMLRELFTDDENEESTAGDEGAVETDAGDRDAGDRDADDATDLDDQDESPADEHADEPEQVDAVQADDEHEADADDSPEQLDQDPSAAEDDEQAVESDPDVLESAVTPDESEPTELEDSQERDHGSEAADEAGPDDASEGEEERVFVNPQLGAGLLKAAEKDEVDVDQIASFDQILARTSTGAVGTANALILPTTGDAPIVAPVTATGDILVTGTLNLPEGLGSHGFALGSADGKDLDAALIDGELPAHSSPTPIAASAAISTVKTPGEVIRPPAPEKGNKLMMTLAITAGALALALVGVLILAFVTGVL